MTDRRFNKRLKKLEMTNRELSIQDRDRIGEQWRLKFLQKYNADEQKEANKQLFSISMIFDWGK